MKLNLSPVLIGAALLFGCGGGDGSGVDSSVVLGQLTIAQGMAVCSNLASEYPMKTVTCGSDTLTVGFDPANCSGSDFSNPPTTCTATVGQLDTCEGDLYDNPCSVETSPPASCAPIEGSDCIGD